MLMLGMSKGGSGTGATTEAEAGVSVCVEEVTIFGPAFGAFTSAGDPFGRLYNEFGVFGGVNGTSTVCEADDTMCLGVAGISIAGGKSTRSLRSGDRGGVSASSVGDCGGENCTPVSA